MCGFSERFAKELTNLLGDNTKVEITTPIVDRSNMVF